MTYRPLNIVCAHPACDRSAERGYWTRDTATGTTRHYCWLHYRDIIDAQRRAD